MQEDNPFYKKDNIQKNFLHVDTQPPIFGKFLFFNLHHKGCCVDIHN